MQGYTSNNPTPDPSFAPYTSTDYSTNNYAKKTVLLPSLPAKGTSVSNTLRYVLGPAQMTGEAIGSAVAQQDQTGAWEVNYTLKGSANSTLWDKVAEENFHLLLGIELDGVVQSAPLIQPSQATFTSFGGQGTISGGNMTEADAKSLALAMEFGSLPVRLNQLTTQTVSPTLGKSALKAGLGAGLGGLIFVLLYVMLYYRALGVVVISGLALTAAMLWAIISALGHTSFSPSFDLAGITGLIVSIGITVDSYIVYFERLKDETRAGRSIRTSVDRGFKSAWRTVWAADFVSLLAAVILYVVAVGDVKGFAFFLGLSTIMDMAVTWFYTRPLVILLGRSERFTRRGRFGIARGLAVRADRAGLGQRGRIGPAGKGTGKGTGTARHGSATARHRRSPPDQAGRGAGIVRTTTTAWTTAWTSSTTSSTARRGRVRRRATTTRRRRRATTVDDESTTTKTMAPTTSRRPSMTPPAPCSGHPVRATARSSASTAARPTSTSWAAGASGSPSPPSSSWPGSSPSSCAAG